MKRIILLFLTIFALGILTCGCSGGDGAKKIFNAANSKGKISKINVVLDEDAVNQLSRSSASAKMYRADVSVDNCTVKGVSIGVNDSLMGSANTKKINYTIDASSCTDNRKAVFELHSCSKDPTYMREIISTSALTESGVKAPFSAYARLSFNDKDKGLYVFAEGVDDCFLERNFDDYQNGNLFEAGSGCDLSIEKDNDYGKYNLVYGGDLSASKIKSLAERINEITKDNAGQVKEFLDVETVLKYFAFNYVFGNYNSYCGNGGCNYYIFENNGYYTIIPGSTELSLGGFDKGLKVNMDTPVSGKGDYPLVKKLLAVEEFKQDYYEYVKWYRDWLNTNFEASVEELDKLINGDVKSDKDSPYTFDVYQNAIRYVDVSSEAATGKGLAEPVITESTTEGTTEADNDPVISKRNGDHVTSGQAIGMRVVSEADGIPVPKPAQAVPEAATQAASKAETTVTEASTEQTTEEIIVYEKKVYYENSFSIINFVRERLEIIDKFFKDREGAAQITTKQS